MARPYSVSSTARRGQQIPFFSAALSPGAVHLWLCRVEEFPDSQCFARAVLSRYSSRPVEDWQFERGEQGKPRVINAPRPLRFNLSHGDAWQVCAVALDMDLGVDIERVDCRRDVLRLARRFFHAAEVQGLQALPPVSRAGRFYDLWTLKEAAVKARGSTLAAGLAELAFDPAAIATSGRVVPLSPAMPVPACYFLCEPLPQYRLALCCLGESDRVLVPRFYQLSGAAARRLPVTASAVSANPDTLLRSQDQAGVPCS